MRFKPSGPLGGGHSPLMMKGFPRLLDKSNWRGHWLLTRPLSEQIMNAPKVKQVSSGERLNDFHQAYALGCSI